MKKTKIGSELLKFTAAAIFACVVAVIPISAEADLHPFLKKENVQVEPNVLLLIDTSGSMTRKMKYDDFTYGDGTRPFISANTKTIYYGMDSDKDNNDASIDFNYHPLLRFIPSAELTNAGINNNTAEKYFAKRVAKTDPPKQSGESDFKYPNDSRMYILKNVMYRILTDDTLISNIRLGLSTYHQTNLLDPWDDWGNYYHWSPVETKTDWRGRITDGFPQAIYWRYSNANDNKGKARLVENFNSTQNTTHLDNIKKWFNGEDDGDHKELRAHGWTPLAVSIYGQANDPKDKGKYPSARTFYEGTDGQDSPQPVVSHECQDNWLIVLTDGEDEQEGDLRGRYRSGDPVAAVKNLYDLYKASDKKKPIRTFVIGIINPNSNKDLAKVLSKMADYGDNGVLDQNYNDPWTPVNSKAYFPQDMEGLFNAFREIFYSIKEQSSTGGAPLATPSRSPSGDDSFYQAQYLPRNGRQWEGYLAKFAKNVANDGTVTYPKKWEVATKLNQKDWDERKIFTAFNGLSGTDSNLYRFNSNSSTAALRNIIGIPAESDTEKFIKWVSGSDVYNESPSGKPHHKLFDIYHSGLVKVGPPAGMSANSLYRKFYTKYEERPTIIYVQSNAGMLHGFNDTDEKPGQPTQPAGDERFAFIPPNVLAGNRLRGLRWPDGGKNYDSTFSYPRYLADGPLIAEDVPLGSGDAKEYRTVLMAQLGIGGAGMYAVDVTDPDKPDFLWAIENSIYTLDNSNKVSLLGESKRNVISWQKNGNSTDSAGYTHDDKNFPADYDYRSLRLTVSTPFIGHLTTGEWAFVMGNGTTGELNENPKGEVFIGNIENGQILKKFQTSANSPIVSPVAVLHDGVSGLIRTFFLGDTSGKVFKADLSDRDNKDNWTIDAVLDVDATVGLSYPLDATRVKNRLWIFVGTGDIEGYLANQSFTSYFVAADITDVQPGFPLKRNTTDLESLSAEDAAAGLDPLSLKKGWFITFKNPGNGKPVERMSTAPAVYNGYVFFSTFTPSDDPCKTTGTSRLYALEAATGISGWKGNPKKYIELKDVKITGLSVSKGELVIGMTNFGSSDLSDFRAIGDNLLLIDAPGTPGGGGESGIMKPLYWKSR